LADFAKLVEAFDAKSISFVAITQQFNTTISTGRLTLNILLSFAQFERELSSERVRDKIAASLAKGKWTGGNIPFGYELENSRKLIDDWLTDPTAHAAELGSVAHTLRDTVILGYQSGKEEDNRLRRNALRVASELVNASAATRLDDVGVLARKSGRQKVVRDPKSERQFLIVVHVIDAGEPEGLGRDDPLQRGHRRVVEERSGRSAALVALRHALRAG